MRALCIALIVLLLLPTSAPAQDDIVALAGAYQRGYLQVVELCCFQLYASTGVVATDFSNGVIDAETALFALDQNYLLLSACISTLDEIISLTPAEDETAHEALGRLAALLAKENQLLSALTDLAAEPSAERAQQADAARLAVEQALDAYTSE